MRYLIGLLISILLIFGVAQTYRVTGNESVRLTSNESVRLTKWTNNTYCDELLVLPCDEIIVLDEVQTKRLEVCSFSHTIIKTKTIGEFAVQETPDTILMQCQ